MLRRTICHFPRMFPFLSEVQPGNYLLSVHAKPGARASAFATPLTSLNTEADLRIAAPPVEGQANSELVRFLDEVVEHGFRELSSDPESYLADTSYAQVVVAEASAAAAASQQSAVGSSGGDKKCGKKDKGKSAGGKPDAAPSASAGQSGKKGSGKAGGASGSAFASLPTRVEVTLVRGGTSRTKTVLVAFPGTRAQLVAILEKESRS